MAHEKEPLPISSDICTIQLIHVNAIPTITAKKEKQNESKARNRVRKVQISALKRDESRPLLKVMEIELSRKARHRTWVFVLGIIFNAMCLYELYFFSETESNKKTAI